MPVDGYLNLLKPPGFTSHDVVARVRRLVRGTRVGHTGTLDPAAVGVLPVALGRATRTVSSPAWDEKLYWADVTLGTATTTDDADGQIVAVVEVPSLDLAALREALRGFVGVIDQRPPAYSAVHVDGQRAYQAARRGVGREPSPRPVRIDALEVARWEAPVLTLRIQCGSGTYIRSIARDLGRALGTVAHLSALVRLRVGPFAITEAVDVMELDRLAPHEWLSVLYPLDIAAADSAAIVEHPSRSLDFHYGRRWSSRPSPRDPDDTRSRSGGVTALYLGAADRPVRVYTGRGELLGLARHEDESYWQPTLAVRSDSREDPGDR